jgi:hypothetical protein
VCLIGFRGTNQPQNIFSSLSFFSTFLGVSQQGEFKNTTNKKKEQKVHVENFSRESFQKIDKSFCKTIDKKSKTHFFLDLFYRVLGRFSVRGVKKHDKKSQIIFDQPWYFFGLRGTNQPPQGPSFCFECPLQYKQAQETGTISCALGT